MGIAAISYASTNAPSSVASFFSGQRKGAEAIPPESQPVAPPLVIFNPQSRYDAGAGVFVTEFRDVKTGDLERQIPDRRQLRAYEDAQRLKSQNAASAASSEATARSSSTAMPADTAATDTTAANAVTTSVAKQSGRVASPTAEASPSVAAVSTSVASTSAVSTSAVSTSAVAQSASSATAPPQLIAVRV